MWKSSQRRGESAAQGANRQPLRACTVADDSPRNNLTLTLRLAIVISLALAGQLFHARAQTETNIYSFGGPPDGEKPRAGLVQGTNGDFYGTTFAGGATNRGVVFRITSAGSETNLYSFGAQPFDGANSSAPLVQGSNGYFYGTTINGGTNGLGAIFRISPGGSYSNLYSFQGLTNDGANPTAGLVMGSDGNFYGTTQKGGTDDFGTVFRFNTNGTETVLYSFTGPTNDGNQPLTGLVLGRDGNFYGTTFFGGITNIAGATNGGTLGFGTVFRISPGGSYSNLYSFGSTIPDGIFPGSMTQGSDGNFYGNAYSGGAFTNRGAVFRITPGGSESLFYSFGSIPNDGSNASSGLMLATDGNFYGTTQKGGTNDLGTVFRLSPGGSETILYSFGSQTNDGTAPLDGVIQGSDGNFYGMTQLGGSLSNGTVFKLIFTLPASRISQIQLAGTNVVLTVSPAPGNTYQLQSTTNLAPAVWTDVAGAAATNSVVGPLNVTNLGGAVGPQRFYRFLISP